jgi:hypothetical protein
VDCLPQTACPGPAVFGATIDRVIKIRASFSDRIAKHNQKVDVASDQRHDYFIGILEKVREVLKPCMPEAPSTPSQPDGPDRLAVRFEGLRVYEPSAEALSDVPVERPLAEPDANVIYEAETQTSADDAFSAFGMMVNDLLQLRARIKWIWSNYRDGFFDASVAAIGTNAAIDLARNIIDSKFHPF